MYCRPISNYYVFFVEALSRLICFTLEVEHSFKTLRSISYFGYLTKCIFSARSLLHQISLSNPQSAGSMRPSLGFRFSVSSLYILTTCPYFDKS